MHLKKCSFPSSKRAARSLGSNISITSAEDHVKKIIQVFLEKRSPATWIFWIRHYDGVMIGAYLYSWRQEYKHICKANDMCFKHIYRANDYNCWGKGNYRCTFIDVVASVYVLLQRYWKLHMHIYDDDKQLYVAFSIESFIHILSSNNNCINAKVLLANIQRCFFSYGFTKLDVKKINLVMLHIILLAIKLYIWKRRYSDNLLVLSSITIGLKELNINNINFQSVFNNSILVDYFTDYYTILVICSMRLKEK